MAEAYRARRGEVVEAGKQLLEQIRQGERLRSSASLLTDGILFSAYQALSGEFDPREGGMGRAPKFPQPMNWEFLLRYWKRTGIVQAQDMADLTLTKMARGGMYDQVGGGFHRYSVDGQWLVPHFEKMLYDNAQLASLYLHGWLATDDPEYRRVGEETLDYILREMTHASGGFFSAQDADSEGVEGKFFVWSAEEIAAALDDPEMTRVALAYWGWTGGPTSRDTASSSFRASPPRWRRTSASARHDWRSWWPPPAPGSTACGTSGCTLASTTRSSPRGTASPSRRSRRPAASSAAPTTSPPP